MDRNERNLEKEKEVFEEAIKEPIFEIPTDFDEESVNSLVGSISSSLSRAATLTLFLRFQTITLRITRNCCLP